jgi:hypothetical protein
MAFLYSSSFLNIGIEKISKCVRFVLFGCGRLGKPCIVRADANNNVGTFCCGYLLLPILEFEHKFQNDHIVMLVNAWNNAPVKFISTAALNREPKMFASVIQLEVVENL